MQSFGTIGIIGRLGNRSVVESVRTLEQLLRRRGSRLLVEQATASMLSVGEHEVAPRKRLGELCDLVVVVGGDGSLLGVARDLVSYQVPVLGINRGGLGFLADIPPEQIEEQVTEVLDGRYNVEQHFLLHAAVTRAGETLGDSPALNDVVVHAGTMARMMEFAVYVDDQFVYDLRSDGLIVASPTGSTAYALSAGGPIMHPNLDAIVIVPMFPHTLNSRPLVIRGDAEIKVVIGDTNSQKPQISCDSQVDIAVKPGDEVVIEKHAYKLPLLYTTDHSFFDACRSKLDWASRLGGR